MISLMETFLTEEQVREVMQFESDLTLLVGFQKPIFTNSDAWNVFDFLKYCLVDPSDDFIEELLLHLPSITHRDDGKVVLTDPFGLSEQIIEIRNDIISEWIEAMNMVPTAHQDGVRGILLNKQMGSWKPSPGTPKDDSNASGGFQ
jgi:hypothetical protein